MGDHRYEMQVRSGAPPEEVFAILVDAPGWADWAQNVSRASYEQEGTPAPHGVGAIRRLGASFGPVAREQVVAYEPPSLYAYVILSGPIPVKGYRSEVRLQPDGDGTLVTWSGRFSTRVPGVARLLVGSVDGFARRLVAEADRRRLDGGPDPRR